MNPARIALLASVGISEVSVYRRPRVAVIVTGPEVQPYDSHLKSYQIRDVNGVMLKAGIEESGGEINSWVRVEDDLAKTGQAREGSDLVLCSGGVSVGRHDHIKEAAAAAGFVELFWRPAPTAPRRQRTAHFIRPHSRQPACLSCDPNNIRH